MEKRRVRSWLEERKETWRITRSVTHFWQSLVVWMALVCTDHSPPPHEKEKIIAILNRFATATRKVQDQGTGVWYDIPDKPRAPKNYPEASASCMLAYTFAKGARKGYLPTVFLTHAQQAYRGILKTFIRTDQHGQVNLHGTVAVSGLGGNPYRDGSYDYYMSEPVIVNDPKEWCLYHASGNGAE